MKPSEIFLKYKPLLKRKKSVEMTFNQKLASYVLGRLTISDLPDIAMTGINEGLESESLLILAGFYKDENGFEILSYLIKVLSELKIELKTEKEAAIEIIRFYAHEILFKRLSVSKGMKLIVADILDATSLSNDSEFRTLYSLYWQLDEVMDYDSFIEKTKRESLIMDIENKIEHELNVLIIKTN